MNPTIQLRRIIEQPTQYETGLSHRERIEIGRQHLFDFDYPIFDEKYRKTFETNFIRHFYTRNIGQEVVGLFKFYLESYLNLHMPYYNQLFESEKIEFDPLINSKMNTTSTKEHDKTETGNETSKNTGTSTQDTDQTISGTKGKTGTSSGTTNDTSTGTNEETDFTRNLSENTPDGRLAITAQDGVGAVEYASKIDEQRETSNQSSQAERDSTFSANEQVDETDNKTNLEKVTGSNVNDLTANRENVENYFEQFTYQKEGKIGVQSYSKLLAEFRQSFLRIEQDIFNEMDDLFMQIYM